MKNKRIVMVTRNLPPLIGGMERLNWHIANELSRHNKLILVSHRKARKQAPKNSSFFAAPLSPLPLFLLIAFIKSCYLCFSKKPDVLLAGSGLTAPIVVFLAWLFKKKSVVYIHGLDINNNSKIYRYCWLPFIRRADKVIANSSPTYALCLKQQLKQNRLSIIHPGVSFPAKRPNEALIEKLKTQYQLHNKQVLISVGRLTQRKGLNEFIEHSFSQITKQVPNTVLVIIGDTPNQSLNKNLQSKELIINTAKKHGVDDKLIFTGNISDDDLSAFFYLADIHVFPVKHIEQDPEGFGMVAVEAAAHATPTIAFATGGIVDAVADKQSGFLINNGQYPAFSQAVIDLLNNPARIDNQQCTSFAEQFSWQHLADKFAIQLSSL